jgi:hypothetical protein
MLYNMVKVCYPSSAVEKAPCYLKESHGMNIARSIFSGLFSFILVIALVALGIALTINHTILNPDFAISEIDKLDVQSIVVEQVKSQLPEGVPYISEIFDEVVAELEPWLKEQTSEVIYAGYAYLEGDEELNIVIPLEQVKSSIKDNLAQAMRESPIPELEGLSQEQLEFAIALACAQVDSQVPQQFEINEALLGTETVTQLQKVREIAAYIRLGYKVLIGLSALLVLLIALIQWWRAKSIARFTGIAFTVAGAISLIAALVAKSIIFQIIPADIPAELTALLPQLISDISYPLLIYSIGILAAGIGLIVLSLKLSTPD